MFQGVLDNFILTLSRNIPIMIRHLIKELDLDLTF